MTIWRVSTSEQHSVPLPEGVTLEEQTAYEWTVTAWDESDAAETSEIARFITGVHAWRGRWIGNRSAKPFIARRRFGLPGPVARAVLSVAGTGQFEARVNGLPAGPYAYEGSQTDFNRHIHYSTYDVAALLKPGENEITVEVANGWYLGDAGGRHFYTADKGYAPYGPCLGAIAQLKMPGAMIATDADWEVSPSGTTLANIYGSEDMDANWRPDWQGASVLDGVCLPKGELIPCNYPPPIRKRAYAPVMADERRMLYDFGRNMSSQFRIRLKGRPGQRVRLLPAEKLDGDGNPVQTVNTCSELVLSGGEDCFEQRFSVNGARWYAIEGASASEVLEFTSYFVTSSAADVGRFECSDPGCMAVYRLILGAIESNLNHLHTDCPTIEKLGWLETSHLMAPSVMYNKDVDTLWDKIALDMRDAQYGDGERDTDTGAFPHEYGPGMIPSIAPRFAQFTHDWGSGSFWDILPWGASVLLAPYAQYRFYGNLAALRENHSAAARYLDYLDRQYRRYPELYGDDSGHRYICGGLGDWGYTQNGGVDRRNIETAFYYHLLTVMAEVSALLGEGGPRWLERAATVREDYNRAFLRRIDGRVGYISSDDGRMERQANQALPLCFGLVPEEERLAVRATLVDLCRRDGVRCGEVGLPYVLRALSDAGRDDLVYAMLVGAEHPSYMRFVRQGETTLPEFWRDDARSRNHDMMGHAMAWFFARVAGIRSDDGFRTVRVEPADLEGIDVDCAFDSVRGRIRVRIRGGRLEVEVPNNVQLQIIHHSVE